MSETVTIVIKPTGQSSDKPDRFSVTVPSESTVLQLKEEVGKECDLVPEEQRLIYKGQILKDHETVAHYGIADQHVVHMVKGKKATAASSTRSTAQSVPTAGTPPQSSSLFPPDVSSAMMNALSNNPELFRTMMQSNPMMTRLMETNPQLAQALNNPEVLRDAARAMSSPGLMQEQMRTNDVALRNIETIPGGYDQLRRMFESTTEAFESAQEEAGAAGVAQGQPSLEQMLGSLGISGAGAGAGAASANSGTRDTGDSSTATPATGPNAAPLPNPWSSGTAGGATAAGLGAGLGGAGGAGGLADMLAAMGGGGGMGGMRGGSNPFAGGANPMQNPAMQENAIRMMQNPQMQQMVTQMMQNPQMQQMLLQQNPQMRDAVEANPALRNLMFSPEMLQASLQAAQSMNAAGGAAGGMQGGLDGTDRSANPLAGLGGGTGGAPPDLAGLMSMLGGAGGAPGASPLAGLGGGANGGTPPDLSGLMSMLGGAGLGGAGGGLGVPPPAPVANPAEAYSTQLQQLQDMGFFDEQENIRALQATGGNVNAAVERLLSA